jgi:hypothetical protein
MNIHKYAIDGLLKLDSTLNHEQALIWYMLTAVQDQELRYSLRLALLDIWKIKVVG